MSATLKVIVLCPHFDPDTAPTGTVMTRIVAELASRGHELHVITSLPWYRDHAVAPGWGGAMRRVERTSWGSIIRLHPFPGDDRTNLVRRALGFVAFSLLALVQGFWVAGPCRKVDAVLAMSPPLTLGPTAWLIARVRRARCVFNIQDVFPDAAVRTGAITNRRVIAAASWLEKVTYQAVDAITVLSDGLADNVMAKLATTPRGDTSKVVVIANFVDSDVITPGDRMTTYRTELGIDDGFVVMYAGNIGFSQSLDLVLGLARQRPDITVVINGEGSAKTSIEAEAAQLPNVRIAGYQPMERLSEVLVSADVHLVPLRAGLGDVSVPSKTYSILAAGRPVIASIDADSAVDRLLAASGGGIAVPPDDLDALVAAVDDVRSDPARRAAMGAAGRAYVERVASPTAVGGEYERILRG